MRPVLGYSGQLLSGPLIGAIWGTKYQVDLLSQLSSARKLPKNPRVLHPGGGASARQQACPKESATRRIPETMLSGDPQLSWALEPQCGVLVLVWSLGLLAPSAGSLASICPFTSAATLSGASRTTSKFLLCCKDT